VLALIKKTIYIISYLEETRSGKELQNLERKSYPGRELKGESLSKPSMQKGKLNHRE